MNRHWLIVPVLLCSARIASAEDLQTVYDHALAADPVMQQAEATHMASRETRTQAILDMLPLNAVASKNWYGVGNQRTSTPAFANLDLQVNLFSWDNWIALKQASSTVAQAEANFLAAPGDSMPLLAPDPASEDAWVTTALSQNSNLIASRMAESIARDGYLTAIGGHLPSINASASRAWDLTGGNGTGFQTGGSGTPLTIDTQDIVWSIGVTVPLFSAGATQSRVRQAKYLWKAGKAGYESALRQTELLARDAYQGVVSQIAQVGALKQAVESNRISLKATEAGYEVGTKTAIDVLSARQLFVQAQTNYAQAKYGYLNDLVALRVAAGNLDRSTIAQINAWLVEPPDTEVPATAPAPPQTPAPAPAAAPAATEAPAPVPAAPRFAPA